MSLPLLCMIFRSAQFWRPGRVQCSGIVAVPYTFMLSTFTIDALSVRDWSEGIVDNVVELLIETAVFSSIILEKLLLCISFFNTDCIRFIAISDGFRLLKLRTKLIQRIAKDENLPPTL